MSYKIKRECWNEKTYNGYTDSPYWRVSVRDRLIGLNDNGTFWAIDNMPLSFINFEDLERIIKECKLKIKLKFKNVYKTK